MVKVKISNNLTISEITEIDYSSDISPISNELKKAASKIDARITALKIENSQITYHSGLKCTWVSNTPTIPNIKKQKTVYYFIKRLFDIAISGLALIVLSPILLTVALIIKLSDGGSVLFKQERVGYKNYIFKILKFRTNHQRKCNKSDISQTEINNHKITKFGKFLQKTNIDRLPQLINILKGEMSLVGPRPFVKDQFASGRPYKEIVPYYNLRYTIIPGLTGWSQANGYHGSACNRERAIGRIEHDMAYIQNMSFWLDIKIIFLTIWRELFTKSDH